MIKKRIRATLYTESQIRFTDHKMTAEHSSNGYLFSGGRWPTKILPQDPPGVVCLRLINRTVCGSHAKALWI